ncbi:hypothetical protein PsorP6_000474 [Peronosclerospora sorghi]|uniref:Uncharacterized protein n=1 Tax=Peronosclerospora sorghi TaxID=230839 RepID=A0ACC0WQU7_9STRA|nr:hypothetical protein PsorP6_000474 [Peronosclerospora sorghi]
MVKLRSRFKQYRSEEEDNVTLYDVMLIVFGIDELPDMKRGQGVILQKYRDAKLGDVRTFDSKEGLSWNLGTKTRLEKDIMSWRDEAICISRKYNLSTSASSIWQ